MALSNVDTGGTEFFVSCTLDSASAAARIATTPDAAALAAGTRSWKSEEPSMLLVAITTFFVELTSGSVEAHVLMPPSGWHCGDWSPLKFFHWHKK